MGVQRCDVVVVGCGGAGSAAAWHLAARGRSVVALDQFEHGHIRGSSHGTERILRVAYADAVHAELAAAALDGWARLERDAGVTLRTPTDGYDSGDDPAEIEQIARQCEAVGVRVDRMPDTEACVRFPGIRFRGYTIRHATATVHADRALDAMRRLAAARGADIRAGVAVQRIEVTGDSVRVHLGDGVVEAGSCVVATGAWAGGDLLADVLGRCPPLSVTREQVGFFRPATGSATAWPTWVAREEPAIYCLPTPDGLVKVGEHHTGPLVDPGSPAGELEPVTWHRLLGAIAARMPGLDPSPLRHATCLYASYPGDTFLVDRVGPIVVATGLSGHGFKFLPELGRRVAGLATGEAWIDNPFALDRPDIGVGASGHR